MVTKDGGICLVLVALLLAGCAPERPAEDIGSFTLALQCGNGTPFTVQVDGKVFLDPRTLAEGNCSVHGANGISKVNCPKAELTVSLLVREDEHHLLRTASSQSDS